MNCWWAVLCNIYDRKVVIQLPYGPIGVYEVTFGDKSAEMEIDDMRYSSAMSGSESIRTSIVMDAKRALAISKWIRFTDLKFKRLRESSTQWGCSCECAGCDQGHHCRSRTKECYI